MDVLLFSYQNDLSYTLSVCLFPVASQSYMEDHLKNKDRLEKEWEALCAYQAEPNTCSVGQRDCNAKKNRTTTVIPCEHKPSVPVRHLFNTTKLDL